jgi:hypothetical protein
MTKSPGCLLSTCRHSTPSPMPNGQSGLAVETHTPPDGWSSANGGMSDAEIDNASTDRADFRLGRTGIGAQGVSGPIPGPRIGEERPSRANWWATDAEWTRNRGPDRPGVALIEPGDGNLVRLSRKFARYHSPMKAAVPVALRHSTLARPPGPICG